MKKLIPFLIFAIPLLCMAQNSLTREYDYDESGNRVLRKTLRVNLAPPAPPDSTPYTANLSPQIADYFVENLAHLEIKIYPNPTTEKVTLEIANWETLQNGDFKLFTMNGQLLQERPVHSITTEVSLAGLARGTYILKVQINDHTEEWKIIKN
jgi:hypothetical protein